ncbi:MobF family relaxase [Microbacterium hominis]|uniref:Relaxase domain-containing protein n=1 Tax=Microbacterium hominis TaxID=162426 RepID=A0A7D4UHP0_9MICO|nr:MobF family relaxase [Microbacterium hominis]QKJ21109.1 relaxase domain-containing protein [Microbacterium hominis]
MRVMSAGDGYKYLLRTVAAADGDRPLSTPLSRYYAEAGTPPGRWLGSGLPALADGRIDAGSRVSEAQLELLLGMGRDPGAGAPLGRAYPVYAASDASPDRANPDTPTPTRRRAVAGYDFTFSLPKSASVLWAVADANTQATIATAHHKAIDDVLAFMEREVVATRAGEAGRDGAVAQVDVTGLIAAAFDHFDSRAGDPQLHTHVVVSNKVRTVFDGKWRSLDGRPLHAATVALSELHAAAFADHLARALGVEWERRAREADRNPVWAVATVPEHLVAEFSSRSRHIDIEKDRLIDEYIAAHGRAPSKVTIIRLRQKATLATRPEKQLRSLADLTHEWRARASRLLGVDATVWSRTAVNHRDPAQPMRAEDIEHSILDQLAERVVEAASERRSTWTRWNLYAEAARQTMGWRFAATEDREAIVAMITDAAEQRSTRLTPPELAVSPAEFRRADETSVFRPRNSARYSSIALLDAEERLLTASQAASAPMVSVATLERAERARRNHGIVLGDDQRTALHSIATSARSLDVLIGPAGAGKTTAMHALRLAWEHEHGRGSVIGLAPSAAAARELADDLGIATENTAKWLHEHHHGRATVRAGQLVIIDEASLADTLTLDRINTLATRAGAKVLLVGDWAQLQSVDAGGAFRMLVEARTDAPELADVHRFRNAWEKEASLDLRSGRVQALDAYGAHDRIAGGDADAMADAAYSAWLQDVSSGRSSVLVADTGEAVAALNRRARAELILTGAVDASAEAPLRGESAASIGDVIITRKNDRRLRSGRDWVRNGARWKVVAVRRDGSLRVQNADRAGSRPLTLPSEYVAENVDLGYAVTAYRAQGITTDTAHAVLEPGTTRENLYVAMTRGRASNTAYVVVSRPDDNHSARHPGERPDATARDILAGVLAHVGAELSAHETIASEQEAWGSIAQLAAEYDTIAASAQRPRWTNLIHTCGLPVELAEAAIESDAFGALTAGLRRAEALGRNVETLLARIVAARGVDDAQDAAAVLHERLERVLVQPSSGSSRGNRGRLIAGLIPEAMGEMDAEMRRALDERAHLVEERAAALVDSAVASGERWVASLGRVPVDAARAGAWRHQARIVAAYRDRYGVFEDDALGAPATSPNQRVDAAAAVAARDRAIWLSRADAPAQPHRASSRTRAVHSP